MGFEPELGQALFTNTPWNEHNLDPIVERALLTIGDVLKGAGVVDENPCFNVGETYEGDVFSMRSYCWCDGADAPWAMDPDYPGHPNGCPSNFEWRDFRAAWYKHVGRGNSQNRPMETTEVAEMLTECLAAALGGIGEET